MTSCEPPLTLSVRSPTDSATPLHPTSQSDMRGSKTPIRIMLCVCQAFHFVNRFASPLPSQIIVGGCGNSFTCLTDCHHFVNMPETRRLARIIRDGLL